MRAMHQRSWAWLGVALGLVLWGCDEGGTGSPMDGGDPPDAATCGDPSFEEGDDGHADPLGASPGEARAGRISAAALPPFPSGLQVWEGGDFVLANDRVALVIEDAGPSDLYDPWGGKPVGVAQVEAGQLVKPADFGELFLLAGRTSLLTERVTVLADGSDGGAAIVRATGTLSPLPFFENLVGAIFPEDFDQVPTAIDYILEPDAEHVDVYMTHRSVRTTEATAPTTLHGFMYTPRMPTHSTGVGFDTTGNPLDFVTFVDDDATNYSYEVPGQILRPGVEASGFESAFTDGFTVPACEELRRHHARLTIGGPGVDGVLQARARTEGNVLRAVSGTVRDATGSPAEGVRVHAETPEGEHLTRVLTDATGSYSLHVPEGQAVNLFAYRRGDAVVGPVSVDAATESMDLDLEPTGQIQVTVTDAASSNPLPVKVQVLPAAGTPLPTVPSWYGEPRITGGRLHVSYPMDGTVTLPAPVGSWDVVVSRGYEYEMARVTADVLQGETATVDVALERVVDTAGVQCADFHIHTRRSNDSGDPGDVKVRSAVANGLEIPVRSDHEFVNDFQPEIEALGLQAQAFGMASVEMTSFVIWGHMGAFPLVPDPAALNGGTPLWQRYPTRDMPDVALETLSPPEVFADVRARAEQPVIIINHPRGATNYFDYAGYDPVTGTVDRPEAWDDGFTLVEVFNNSGWNDNRTGTVRDWLSFLNTGRRVFAVGSSDSHKIRSSPVGYPRTCITLGTDDPRDLTPNMVRDEAAAGRMTVSGGVYVDASVNGVGPGGEVTGVGSTANLDIRIQAASWVIRDTDTLTMEIVVDGMTATTVEVVPGDANPTNPVERFDQTRSVDVAPTGSYVIVAVYADTTLDPVHPGKVPFGVTNPIFLSP